MGGVRDREIQGRERERDILGVGRYNTLIERRLCEKGRGNKVSRAWEVLYDTIPSLGKQHTAKEFR